MSEDLENDEIFDDRDEEKVRERYNQAVKDGEEMLRKFKAKREKLEKEEEENEKRKNLDVVAMNNKKL